MDLLRKRSIVLGNCSCDLDSVASSIAYAYLLKMSGEFAEPVLSIPASDLLLRTEVTYVLKVIGIETDTLLFTDSDYFRDEGSYLWRVHLVDHNLYNETILNLSSYEVASIIDHHEDENGYFNDFKRLEMVGSCATLIASLFKERNLGVTKELRILLGAAILVDTINLDFEKGRATHLDAEMLEYLAIHEYSLDSNEFYRGLISAKTDISKLSIFDLLRRDSKNFECKKGSVFISSLTGLTWDEFIMRENVLKDVSRYITENEIHILAVMFASHNEDTFNRYLAIKPRSSLSNSCVSKLVEALQLVLITPSETFDDWLVFKQLDVEKSRKVVLPLLKNLLK